MIRMIFLLGCILLLGLTSCEKELIDPSEKQQIENYLNNQGISAIQEPDAGYYYFFYQSLEEEQNRIEATLNAGQTAEVLYQAILLDGTVIHDGFADNRYSLIEIDESIYGLQLVLTKMAIGEEIFVVLPSRLAYGEESPSPLIPPSSILVFRIYLEDVHPHF